ncbi:hypothetical protein Acr_00g0060400 [Actinidia rufa]|uniref:histidine kinase n=1 Tax=Actinidia rufa TaxID=165716 RepID=A0A7J0DNF3_9ERIC|nr:hypothetical protein Acr_00g0060400 [Actinidia rufa]
MNRSLAFATASHDIRSSLAAIDSFIQLYLEEDTLNSDMATNLQLIKEFDLVQLLEDVVDIYYVVGMDKNVDVVVLDLAMAQYSNRHISVRVVVKKPSRENAIIASYSNGVWNCLSRLCYRNNASFSGLDELQTVKGKTLEQEGCGLGLGIVQSPVSDGRRRISKKLIEDLGMGMKVLAIKLMFARMGKRLLIVYKLLSDQRRGGHSQTHPFDYIFLDCEMPVVNGHEATKLIRMEEKHYGIRIPITALSPGMDFHLTKPIKVHASLDVNSVY